MGDDKFSRVHMLSWNKSDKSLTDNTSIYHWQQVTFNNVTMQLQRKHCSLIHCIENNNLVAVLTCKLTVFNLYKAVSCFQHNKSTAH